MLDNFLSTASVATAAMAPRPLPALIVDLILKNTDPETLFTCSLVCSSWVYPSRTRLLLSTSCVCSYGTFSALSVLSTFFSFHNGSFFPLTFVINKFCPFLIHTIYVPMGDGRRGFNRLWGT